MSMKFKYIKLKFKGISILMSLMLILNLTFSMRLYPVDAQESDDYNEAKAEQRRSEIDASSDVKNDLFTDTEGHWAKDEIDYAASKDIIKGIGENIFEPERVLTKGEFFAIAARTFRLSGNAENVYGDVKADDWFSEYVSALKNSNLIPNEMLDSNGNLNCSEPIIREQAAAVVWNAFYNAYKNEHNTESNEYSDIGDISLWAKDSVLKLADTKIITGEPSGRFNPKGTITAAQAAVIAYRLRTTDEAYTAVLNGDGGLIEKEINDAYNRGAVKVVIPPGTYDVPEGTPGTNNYRSHILLERMQDFTLEGYGVDLVYQVVDCAGLQLLYCRNVTIRGFSTDYRIGFNSQGEIINVDSDNKQFTLRIDEGYNNEFDDPFWGTTKTGYVFDPDTLKMAKGYANVAFSVQKDTSAADGRTWICTVNDRYTATQLKPGLLLAFRQNGSGTGMNTRLGSCSGTTIEDYNIYMGQMGLLEQNSWPERNYIRTHLKNVKVTYGPTPKGATRKRLMSTNADGLHFAECQYGPVLENCTVEGNGDDGIAVHGYFKMVMEEYNNNFPALVGDYEQGKSWIIAGMWGNESVRPGDVFKIYDSKGRFKAETKIARKSVGVSSGDTTRKNMYYTTKPNKLGQQTLYSYSIYSFEDVLDLEYGDILVNTNMMGEGFEIRNSAVLSNSTRGMLITASNGIIENCTVDGSRSGGIVFLPEIGWAQSGYTENLTIRNCNLMNIGSGYNGGLGIPNTSSAVKISSDVEGRNHENIILDNNRFENNWGYDIELGNAKNIVVKNNYFGAHAEEAKGFKHSECIYAENCENLDVKSCNRTAENRTFYAASSCENLKGATPISIYPLTVTDNQDGIWRYQYSPLGTNKYYDFNFCQSTMEGYTPTFTWWVGSQWNTTYGGVLSYSQIATGSSADVTYTFVAPKDGKIECTIDDGVRVNPASVNSDGVKFKIMKGDKNLYPKVGWQTVLYGEAGIVNEKVITTVKKGDRIHFRVNCLGNTYYDNIVFSPMIRYQEVTAEAETTECSIPENYTNINF